MPRPKAKKERAPHKPGSIQEKLERLQRENTRLETLLADKIRKIEEFDMIKNYTGSKRPGGRPKDHEFIYTDPKTGKRSLTYTREAADKILGLLAQGVAITTTCRVKGMPSRDTYYDWYHNDLDGLKERHRVAEEMRAHFIVDEILDLADSATPEDVKVQYLRIETRKWLAGTLAMRYSPKAQITHEVGQTLEQMVLASLPPESVPLLPAANDSLGAGPGLSPGPGPAVVIDQALYQDDPAAVAEEDTA